MASYGLDKSAGHSVRGRRQLDPSHLTAPIFRVVPFFFCSIPMNMVSNLRNHLVGVRIKMRAVHPLKASSRDDMKQMADHGIDHEHLAVLVEVKTPRIGRAMGNHFERE